MNNALLGFAIVCLASSFVGYGLVVASWSILSAVTARVAKPTKNGLSTAAAWVIFAWVVMTLLVMSFILLTKSMSFWYIAAIIPVSALASVAGGCYGNTETD